MCSIIAIYLSMLEKQIKNKTSINKQTYRETKKRNKKQTKNKTKQKQKQKKAKIKQKPELRAMMTVHRL